MKTKREYEKLIWLAVSVEPHDPGTKQARFLLMAIKLLLDIRGIMLESLSQSGLKRILKKHGSKDKGN